MMEVKENMCDALRELMEDEFQEFEKQVTEQITEQVTEQMTSQMIENAYESIKDKVQISQILKVPLEVVEKVLSKERAVR